jgi:hypothetical protein
MRQKRRGQDERPEWASSVDAKLLDKMIAKGYLQPSQRNDWVAIEIAINDWFHVCVQDTRPELSPQRVIEQMLRPPKH